MTHPSWQFTDDPATFNAVARHLLAADPAGNTVALSILANTLATGPDGTSFGWCTEADGRVTGAALHTPGFRLLVVEAPDEALDGLVTGLLASGRTLPGVYAPADLAARMGAAWRERTGQEVLLGRPVRLFVLDQLTGPSDFPDGAASVADDSDRALVTDLLQRFAETIGQTPVDAEGKARALLAYRGVVLWRDATGTATAMAAITRVEAGMARVTYVFTVPEARGRGYGAAATVEATRLALARGAREVVLFTDLANPVTNRLYPRLGFRPRADRLELDFRARGT